jgi:hypothetical protein
LQQHKKEHHMKKSFKRVLSCLLVVLILLPTAILPAHAAGQDITALFGDGAFAEDVRFPPQAR